MMVILFNIVYRKEIIMTSLEILQNATEFQLNTGLVLGRRVVEGFFESNPSVVAIYEWLKRECEITLPPFVKDQDHLRGYLEGQINYQLKQLNKCLVDNEKISLEFAGRYYIQVKRYMKDEFIDLVVNGLTRAYNVA